MSSAPSHAPETRLGGIAERAALSPETERENSVVAAILRGRDGVERLAVSLQSFEGRPFVALAVEALRRGVWWRQDSKVKLVSVRVSEIDQVIAALTEAKRQIGGGR